MSRTIVRFFFFFISLAAGLSAAQASQGTDVGYLVGVKDATFANSASGETFTSEAGFMAGAIAVGEIAGDFYFRAGGYFSQRVAKASVSGVSGTTITLDYLDIPITAMYKFNDMFGLFAGFTAGIKITDNCSDGGSGVCNQSGYGYTSPAGLTTAAQLGINVKFHPNWAGELFYEVGLGDVSTGTTSNAISADIMFIY